MNRKNYFSITAEITAPASLVWLTIADVERWPEWTPSVSRVKLLSPGPLQIGSRVRIHQPKLPPAIWQVVELTPGKGFTWVSTGPGLRVTARHTVESVDNESQVTLSIQYEGLFGPLLARFVGKLNDRYLALEANGLQERGRSLGNALAEANEVGA